MANYTVRTESARELPEQVVHYLFKSIGYDTPNIQTTAGKIVYFGVLPANAMPMDVWARIKTSFDGTFIIGTSNNTSAFATSVDITAGTSGLYITDRPRGQASSLDVPLYVQLTTGSTIGAADVWLSYMPAK